MNPDLKTRLGGLMLLVSGGVLSWLSIWKPYQAALAGSPTVSLNTRGIGLAVLFPILGVILLAGGERVNEHFKSVKAAGRTNKLSYVYIGLVALVAVGAYMFVKSRFALLGYSDS
jgi:hypothetical protein